MRCHLDYCWIYRYPPHSFLKRKISWRTRQIQPGIPPNTKSKIMVWDSLRIRLK